MLLPPKPCLQCGLDVFYRSQTAMVCICVACGTKQPINSDVEIRSVCCACGHRQMTTAKKSFKCFKCGKSNQIQDKKTGGYPTTIATFPLPSMASKHVRLKKMDDVDRYGVDAKKGVNYTNLKSR